MLAGFNWQRQLIILVFAAAMSLWWTSKQGLWAAISGHTAFDKDWAAANVVLKKKLGLKYEVMEATNQREDRRTLILSPRQPAQPQTIMAELFPIIKPKANPGRKKGRLGDRPKKKSQKELHQEREEKRRQQRLGMGKGKRGKAMAPKEAVGKLRIYDDKLLFLKDLFMEDGSKRPESLIEVPDPAAEAVEAPLPPPPRGQLPTNPIPKQAPHGLPQAPPHAAHPAASAYRSSPSEGDAPKMHKETEL